MTGKTSRLCVFATALALTGLSPAGRAAVRVELSAGQARIENIAIAVEFNLSDGTYSGIDKSDNTTVFKDAWFRLGQGGWKEPECIYKAELVGKTADRLGKGQTLRVWYLAAGEI